MSDKGLGVLIILFLVAATSLTILFVLSMVFIGLWMANEHKKTGEIPKFTEMVDRLFSGDKSRRQQTSRPGTLGGDVAPGGCPDHPTRPVRAHGIFSLAPLALSRPSSSVDRFDLPRAGNICAESGPVGRYARGRIHSCLVPG